MYLVCEMPDRKTEVQFLELLRVLGRGSGKGSWGVGGGGKVRKQLRRVAAEGKPSGAAVGILHSPEAVHLYSTH